MCVPGSEEQKTEGILILFKNMSHIRLTSSMKHSNSKSTSAEQTQISLHMNYKVYFIYTANTQTIMQVL